MTSALLDSSITGSLADAAAALVERVRQGVVVVRGRGGGGSGTIWAADGLIVTNSHVVRDTGIEVQLWDGREFMARLVARDPEYDLAALRINAAGLPALSAADSSMARVGQLVFAVGNPWGQRGSVTAGIVLSTTGATLENRVPLPEAIRAHVGLAPGNSGGPLVDAEGRVLGINAMIAGGMAVAVPSNRVTHFLTAEAPACAWLGIHAVPVPLPPAIAASYRMEDGTALMVTEIADNSPAARAGLLPGDVLLGLDGAHGNAAIAERLRHLRPGTPLRLALLRGGRPHAVDAVPEAAKL